MVSGGPVDGPSYLDDFDRILAVDLTAHVRTIRAALPHLKECGEGRIVNIASTEGSGATKYNSAYVAAKHGVIGLTKTIALEGAEHNVTCNAICPGYVWTPLVENQIDDTAKARGITRDAVIRDVLLAAQPNKRFAEVDELGALAVFLCGPGGRSITGIALPIDGGWTAH
jgi:3-hydroxybutyrate dehydrogenase